MRTMKPVSTRLLVAAIPKPAMKNGLHLLPGARWAGDGDHQFHVISVGPKVTDIQPGDRVICIFDEDGLTSLEGDRQKRGFIWQKDVLAVIPRTSLAAAP